MINYKKNTNGVDNSLPSYKQNKFNPQKKILIFNLFNFLFALMNSFNQEFMLL